MSEASTRSLPSGMLTFLFSDIEGSTRLVAALGPAFTPLLERHHALLRAAFNANRGVEVATEGDSFFVVFESAAAAVIAAAAAQRSLAAEAWPAGVAAVRVRMGLHTGEGTRGGDNYVGLDVHRAARIATAAHGGQVLLSDATRALVAASLPDDLALRDLGAHRLKDLERPERLVQLVVAGLPDDFPPPRTLETPSNLPVQMTTFVGRRREVDDVIELLGRSRVITLTGPGGTGKTRLSLEVAQQSRRTYPDGTFFVDLSTTDDPVLVPAAVARALGVHEEPRRPVVESLGAHLRDLRVLLVLDNFEQVLEAASIVGELVQIAPGLTVLATSREALHVRGEQEYGVPPLEIPAGGRTQTPEALAEYDAVALFVQCARAVRPDFVLDTGNAAAVASIAARLDGLPLALELAAARVKLLSPDAVLARLERRLAILTSTTRGLPERQRTLRSAIDWSHDLLSATERNAFRRLAVFVGGCSIDSAVAVCDPEGELGVEMLDVLASLVDKSLVRQPDAGSGEPRFTMLETIREYAMERLAESDDAGTVRLRHAEHFAALAARAESELVGVNQKQWLDALEAERGNLRAAALSAADDGRLDTALAMAASLWRFWQQRAHLSEGRVLLEGLLGRDTSERRSAARVRALGGLGGLAYWQGDIAGAGAAYAEAVDLARSLDEPRLLAEAVYDAGYIAAIVGDHASARRDYEESLDIFERLGDEGGPLRVREALVFVMFHEGDYAAAEALQQGNLVAFRQSGEPFRIANTLNLLSAIQLRAGAFDAARASQAEAVGLFRASGNVPGVIRVLILAAALAVAEGQFERAARLSGAADMLMEPLGTVATPMQILRLADPAAAARESLGDEAFEEAHAAGRSLTVDEMVAMVRTGG